jgi:tetratricopeptide (TPR) repeat protein
MEESKPPRPRKPKGEVDVSDELAMEDLEELEAAPTAAPPPPPRSGTLKPPAAKMPRTEEPRRARTAVKSHAPVNVRDARKEAPIPEAERLRVLCEAQIADESDPNRKARIAYELGRIAELEQHDLSKAAQYYEQAIRFAPAYGAAIRGARRALSGLGRYPELPPLFDAEIAITRDPVARARLLVEKARVLEMRLSQNAPALAVYREALALDPTNVAILKAIEHALKRDNAWQPLAQIYELLASSVSDAPLRAAWTAMRAHLTETRLSDPAQAATLYLTALEIDPHATPALAHVKRLGAAHHRWPELRDVLRKEHGLTKDEDARQAILRRIAQLEEKYLGDAEAALRTIEEALQTRPDDRALLWELVRLSVINRRPPVGALARLAEQTEEGEEMARICHRVGHVFENELKDPERARPWYEKAIASDPAHRSAALALIQMFEERQDWTALLRVLTTRANAITTPTEQADLYHRMGNLLEERLGRAADATAHHARALGLDPDHHESFRALARLLTAASRWHELAELYGRAIDRAPHDAQAIAWLFRLGGVLEDRLNDPHGALTAYERILERDPVHLGALHAVARASERAGRYDRVVSALHAEAQITADEVRKNALLHRAAVITNERMNDAGTAARLLETILHHSPAHRASLETLAELYARNGRWDELVGLYRRLLPLVTTTAEKVRLYMQIGELEEGHLGKESAAINSYRLAKDADPDHEAAREAWVSALERTNAHDALAKALEEGLGRIKDPAARARAATDLGALYEERLNDPQRALASYERAVQAVPLHRPALDARERLLSDPKGKEKLALVLQQEAESSVDEYARLQAALRAAMVLAEQMGTEALEAFRPIFTARPGHVGALLAIEEVYERAADSNGLAATYERMADIVTDPKAKLAALRGLALARAATPETSVAAHQRVLALASDDTHALDEVASIAEASGDTDSQMTMYARLARIAGDKTLAAYYQCRVGAILLARGDARNALTAYGQALGADPWSLTATDGLTRAARAAQDPVAMQQAAHYENLVTRDRGTAVALLIEAARLLSQHDHEDDAAVAYASALSLEPDHPEAAVGLMGAMMRSERIPQLVELLTQAAHAAKDQSRISILHLCVAQLDADLLADLGAAVAAARRAVDARPEHLGALSSLATYLERDAQWNEAVEALERLIAKAKDQTLVTAHLRLANVAEKHLDDNERAKKSLRVVLEMDENHADALTSLVRLERLSGNDEEALKLARKLISVVTDDVHRAAALAEMAELEKKRGQLDEAATASYWAIGVQGPGGSAARLYRTLITAAPQHASWDHYATAVLTYLDRAKKKGGDFASAYRELARVFGEAHHRPDRAMTILREAVEVIPLDASISLSLVKALRAEGSDGEALSELRRFLSVDVLEVGIWRNLGELLGKFGGAEGAACAYSALVELGQATEDEERIARGRRALAARAPAGILGESGLRVLIDGTALDDGLAAFIPAIADIVKQLEGFEPERWGVNKRDRIRPGDPHPMRSFADRIARIFGVPEYDLYVGVTTVSRPYIISGGPPALLIPPGFDSLREAVLAFHVARPLALLSRGLHPLDHIDDSALERLVVGTVRQFDPRFKMDPMFEDDELDKETKRVAKAIGFFSRGRIQEAVSEFSSATPTMIPVWTREIRRAAARAALVVADDLLGSLEALGEPLGPDNYASDLARFWVSDPAIRFRRAVGHQS